MVDRRRVAVVGSGVAGLTAAYVLQRECDVTLFEADERMLASREHYTWIVKCIFPGGQIPSVPAIRQHAGAAGLQVGSCLSFGFHYVETLRRWRAAFDAHTDAVTRLGFDDTFTRIWRLYLAYSEAGFRAGYLDLAQLDLTKPALP